MASEVDLCNLALACLGDDATVSSLNPPEGSAQAAHCARFYPMARDAMLDEHPWSFTTRRATLALLSAVPPPSWQYAYAAPANMNNPLAVYTSDAPDDTQQLLSMGYTMQHAANTGIGVPTPQPYKLESLADGSIVIYTNVETAVLLYTAYVTDTTKFPPLFTEALSRKLASFLAGPLLKGETGREEAKAQLSLYMKIVAAAKVSDANQQKLNPQASPSWLVNR